MLKRATAAVALCAGLLFTVCVPQDGRAQAPDPQRAVLVTGASSGIGRATAELLAERGYFVYAGARSADDIAELNTIDDVMAVRLDVTVPAEVEAAVETIRAEGRGLYGLINNAGVAVLDPLIEVDEDDLLFQLDVNVLGPYRVTRAFAPLLIESRGRVSTTGSLSGFVTWAFGGPYTMSKHAVEAFTDVLAVEMEPFGVRVSVIEPGNFNSRIYDNLVRRREERGTTTEGSLYGDRLDGMLEFATTSRQAPEPTAVAEAFYSAMTDADPKRRYLVAPVESEALVTLQAIIQRLVEVNEDHDFTVSRERLVQMLDEALAAAGG